MHILIYTYIVGVDSSMNLTFYLIVNMYIDGDIYSVISQFRGLILYMKSTLIVILRVIINLRFCNHNLNPYSYSIDDIHEI